MLTILTTAHADRDRPTLKDDEQFRETTWSAISNFSKRNSNYSIQNLKQSYTKCNSKPINLKAVVNTIQHDERKTMNIDKDKLQMTGKYVEDTKEINAIHGIALNVLR